MRRLADDRRGTVFAEFLLAFAPFFLLFLGALQLALLCQAHLVVEHAALRAVRSAVLTIDDDPYFYGDEARKRLSTQAGAHTSFEPLPALLGVTRAELPLERRGGDRLSRIRAAAYVPLSILSPGPDHVARLLAKPVGTLSVPGSDTALLRILAGYTLYTRAAAAITFPRSPKGRRRDLDREPFADAEVISARVSFLFPCLVPLARGLICDVGPTLIAALQGGPTRPDGQGARPPVDIDGSMSATQTDTRSDLGQVEWPALQLAMLSARDERFKLIQKEASLPNHGAAYAYPSELHGREEAAP